MEDIQNPPDIAPEEHIQARIVHHEIYVEELKKLGTSDLQINRINYLHEQEMRRARGL